MDCLLRTITLFFMADIEESWHLSAFLFIILWRYHGRILSFARKKYRIGREDK